MQLPFLACCVVLQQKSCVSEHVQFMFTPTSLGTLHAAEYATRKPYGNLTRLSPSRESLVCVTTSSSVDIHGTFMFNKDLACELEIKDLSDTEGVLLP